MHRPTWYWKEENRCSTVVLHYYSIEFGRVTFFRGVSHSQGSPMYRTQGCSFWPYSCGVITDYIRVLFSRQKAKTITKKVCKILERPINTNETQSYRMCLLYIQGFLSVVQGILVVQEGIASASYPCIHGQHCFTLGHVFLI